MFTEQQLKVIQYCATECEHQASGEPSVYDMVNAWEFMASFPKTWPFDMDFNPTGEGINKPQKITLNMILDLAAIVEPVDNRNGFRTHAVGIRDWNYPTGIKPIGSNWENIERDLSLLIESYYEGNLIEPIRLGDYDVVARTAAEYFYFMYESIHPFADGNGRTGKILYNYLCGTLENPIWPPNFFGGEHP